MAIKYFCPNCGKRFVEWGAEKLGFKCPDCTDEALVRVGQQEERKARRPAAKRVARRPVVRHEEEPVDERAVAGGDEGDEEVETTVEEEVFVGVGRAEADFIPDPDALVAEETDEEPEEVETAAALPFDESASTENEEIAEAAEFPAPEWES